MKHVVQLVRKCWNLEMTKEKFRCYLSCFLRHRNSMHSHTDIYTITCVEFSFGFSKNNKLQHISVEKKKMVNDYLNLELTNMVTYFKHATKLLLLKNRLISGCLAV